MFAGRAAASHRLAALGSVTGDAIAQPGQVFAALDISTGGRGQRGGASPSQSNAPTSSGRT